MNDSPFIIALTQRVDSNSNTGEKRDATDQNLSRWLIEAGFLPVPVPNSLVKIESGKTIHNNQQLILNKWIEMIRPKALVLSGGNDIDECKERDATESYLLSWADKHRIPALGICRGLQMMASWAGGNVIEVDGHIRTRHELVYEGPDTNFPKTVNSFHRWAPRECPPHFRIMARCRDGMIEAIAHKHLRWEGWMWHPERELPFSPKDTQRLKKLFNA